MLLLASEALEASTKLGTIRTTKVKHRITQLPRQPQDSFQNSGHMLKVYQFSRFSFVKLMQEVHRQTQEREAGASHRLGSGMKFLGTVGEPGARGQQLEHGAWFLDSLDNPTQWEQGAGIWLFVQEVPQQHKRSEQRKPVFPSCCGRFRS